MPIWTKSKLARNLFFQKVFLPIAGSQDQVIVDGIVPSELQDHWKNLRWEVGQPISLKNQNLPYIKLDCELIEFGKIHSLVEGGLYLDENIWRSSAFLNSKVEQAKYSKEIDYADEVLAIAHSPEDILDFAEGLKLPIILKEAWNNSGKGHTVWNSTKDNYKLNRVIYPCVMEIFQTSRNLDFGILLQCSRGEIQFLDITQMIIGKDFNYKGSFYYPQAKPDWLHKVHLFYEKEYPFAQSWQKFISSENYEGPISIDGFLSEDGSVRIRSEINFRYTIGRVGYEIMKKRKENDSWSKDPPKQTGILILHRTQKLEPSPDFELILSLNDKDPWRIVYIEYRDQLCRSIL